MRKRDSPRPYCSGGDRAHVVSPGTGLVKEQGHQVWLPCPITREASTAGVNFSERIEKPAAVGAAQTEMEINSPWPRGSKC